MPERNNQTQDLIILEELFLNQLALKVSSLFDFLKLSPEHEKEIESFLNELINLSSQTRGLLIGADDART